MPSLPNARGTDEEEPVRTEFITMPSEFDTQLAEEFGTTKSDVGHKLSKYHAKHRESQHSTKKRYGPGSQQH